MRGGERCRVSAVDFPRSPPPFFPFLRRFRSITPFANMSVGHGTGGGGPFPRRRDTAFHRPHAHTQIDGKERRGRTKTLMEKRGGKERRKERCRINIQAPRAIFALPIFHHFFPAYKSRLKISRMLFCSVSIREVAACPPFSVLFFCFSYLFSRAEFP